MDAMWLRILIFILGVIITAGYYFFVVLPKGQSRRSHAYRRKPINETPPARPPEEPSDDVTIVRRISPEGQELPLEKVADSAAAQPMQPEAATENHSEHNLMEATATAEQAETNLETSPEVHADTALKTVQEDVAPPVESMPEQTIEGALSTTVNEEPSNLSADDMEASYSTEMEATTTAPVAPALSTDEMDEMTGAHETASAATIPPQLPEGAYIAPDDIAAAANMAKSFDELAPPEPTEPKPVQPRTIYAKKRKGLGGLFAGLMGGKQNAQTAQDDTLEDDSKSSKSADGQLSYTPQSNAQVAAEATIPQDPMDGVISSSDDQLRKMVVISLFPHANEGIFRGHQIKMVMENYGLALSSRSGFFESVNAIGGGDAESVFSVGHLRGNGRFERTKISGLETTGLVFFMYVPGPVNAADAIDMMFSVAAKSAKMLNAKVCDQHRRKLTVDQMVNIRDEIVSFETALVDQKLL